MEKERLHKKAEKAAKKGNVQKALELETQSKLEGKK